MGKKTGFLEYARTMDAAISPTQRVKNFSEFHNPMDQVQRQQQGARCMNCGVPFCQSSLQIGSSVSGCPLHNLIPEWNDEIFRGNWRQALARLCKTNNFPEFTGRICPALCESACTCGLYDSPVTVRENELAIIEKGFASGAMKPHKPIGQSGRSIAIVGSGPAGLAAADQLNQRGHRVTVFERDAKPGGLLMYGIPNMKLDKDIVARRINLLEAEGIEFCTNTDISTPADAQALLNEYDAVILCCGAREPRDLTVPGRELNGVCFAVDYLSDVTRGLLGEQPKQPFTAAGKHVIVIGGGDTGNDCIGTSIRQGCLSVTQLVRKPKQPDERPADNAWPQISKASKTDYGQEESIAVFGHDPRLYQTSVKEILSEDGETVNAVKVIHSEPVTDENGRVQMVEVPGSEQILPCDLLLIAAGFSGCQSYVADAFGLTFNSRGTVASPEGGYATELPKVFSAGDVRRGASLAVWAIAEGRGCAKEVDTFLMGYSNML